MIDSLALPNHFARSLDVLLTRRAGHYQVASSMLVIGVRCNDLRSVAPRNIYLIVTDKELEFWER